MGYGAYFNEAVETMEPAKLRAMQETKLRTQLKYNAKHSSFYREKFAAAGLDPLDVTTIEDLARLPFTTKDELRDSQLAQPPLGTHAAASMERVIRVHSSSGTTGRPSYVGITAHDRRVWTEVVSRVYWCEGVRPNSIVAMGFGIGFFVGGLPLHDAVENIGATFLPIGTGASDRLLSSCRDLNADILTCTPSYAAYLAEYAQTKMRLDPKSVGIRRILCGAEPGGGVPGVRRKLEELWGCEVTEGVGNADIIPVYGAECPQRSGNHVLCGDVVILEIIDPRTGKVIEPAEGVTGELVATHIERECVPLVRFRSRDHIQVWTAPCPCGRTSWRLRIIGRTDDMLILRGVNVWPSAIKDVISSMRPRTTGEVRILLRAPGPRVDPPLRVQVEHGPGVDDPAHLKRDAEELLRAKLVFTADVEVVAPGALPRYEMKAQLIQKLYEAPAR
ncbi:MAG: AMP-binding protein [Candidatus Tectomicrobia bacterium]|nr:AMP-binding protein [Candidatus Tectomicrobia bacterium]